MGFFNDLFGGGDEYHDPAAAANKYHEQIPAIGKEYYNPFIEQGKQASDVANPIYNQMSQNPMDFLNNIMRGYTPSEGYKFKEKYLQNNAHNTAAAGGFAGTENDVMGRNEGVNGLLNTDMQEFLSRILGIQQGGLQGQENKINRGFQGASSLADLLSGNLNAQAGLAYQGAHGRNMFNQGQEGNAMNMFSNLIGTGASLFGGGGFGGGGQGGYSPVSFG